MNKNIHYAVFSGCCASTASVFGKLFGLPAFQDSFIIRAVCFALMLLCNGGVWTLFVKALHQSSSSLTATVTSSASNFILSGIIGFIVFQEVTSLLWWTGLSLIIVGLLLVLKGDSSQLPDEIKSK